MGTVWDLLHWKPSTELKRECKQNRKVGDCWFIYHTIPEAYSKNKKRRPRAF